MTLQVNVHEAKTTLSRLLERVEAGEEVIIARNGKPVARLTAMGATPARVPGRWRGQVLVRDDVDAPLPDGLAAAFAGQRP